MDGPSKVTSVQNGMVKHARSLMVPKKLKESEDFLCEGFHLVEEALKAGLKLRFILASASAMRKPEAVSLEDRASRAKVRWVSATDAVLQYLSDTPAPQGLAAVVKKPETRWPNEPVGHVLAVHGVQDPGNLGSLLRTAEAASCDGIILTEGCCDPFNPKAVRASMGSLFRLPFVSGVPWREAQEWLAARGAVNTALVPRDGDDITRLAVKPRAFWVGAEGEGLPLELVNSSPEKASIPMGGEVESLNVGTAAAIALYYKGFRGPVP